MELLQRFRARTSRRQHVEGTVLTMFALVAIEVGALSAHPAVIATATLSTVGVYWLANVYADVIAVDHALDEPAGLRRAARASAREEAYMFEPTIALLAIVVALRLSGVELAEAVQWMLAGGCLVLASWGYVAARRHGNNRTVALLTGFVGSLLGILVIIAKSQLH